MGVESQIGGPNDPRAPEDWRPEDGFVYWPSIAKKPRRQCCARRRRGGGVRCLQVPKAGKRTCFKHGGAPGSGRPPIHGLYSKKTLGRFAREYERHLEHERILDTTPDIAMLGTAAEIVLEQGLRFGDTPTFRVEAYRLFLAVRSAMAAGDAKETSARMGELGGLLRQGYDVARAFREGTRLVERRAVRAEKETIRSLKAQKTLTERTVETFFRIATACILRDLPGNLATRLLDSIESALASEGPAVVDVAALPEAESVD